MAADESHTRRGSAHLAKPPLGLPDGAMVRAEPLGDREGPVQVADKDVAQNGVSDSGKFWARYWSNIDIFSDRQRPKTVCRRLYFQSAGFELADHSIIRTSRNVSPVRNSSYGTGVPVGVESADDFRGISHRESYRTLSRMIRGSIHANRSRFDIPANTPRWLSQSRWIAEHMGRLLRSGSFSPRPVWCRRWDCSIRPSHAWPANSEPTHS